MEIKKTTLEVLIRESVREVLEEQGFFQKLGSIAKQAVGVSSISQKHQQENIEKIIHFISPWVESIIDSDPILAKMDPQKIDFKQIVFDTLMSDSRFTHFHTNDARIQKALGVTPTTPEDRKAIKSLVTLAVHEIIDNMVEAKEQRVHSAQTEKERQAKDRQKQQGVLQQAYDSKIEARKKEAGRLGYEENTPRWNKFVFGSQVVTKRH